MGGRDGSQRTVRYCSRACAAKSRRVDKGSCAQCATPLVGRGKHTYCSRECYYAAKRAQTGERIRTFTCARCGKEFQRYVSQRRGAAVYCSGECRSAGRVYTRGPDHPSWKGGTHMHQGYIVETDYTRRRPNGAFERKYQHVRIAEKALGRPLAKGEHVHHLNGERLDNRPENLLVLTSSQHRSLHHFYSKQFQVEHSAAGDLERLTRDFLASLA